MKIDWFTIFAQIVNFAVLVYLLKRFLYLPVMRIMKEREDKVKETILSSDKKVSIAEKEFQSLKLEKLELEKNKAKILKATELSAEKQVKQSLDEARNDLAVRNETWKKSQQKEWDEFHKGLRIQIQSESIEICKHIMRELADSDLQDTILKHFIQKIQNLQSQEKTNLKNQHRTIIVRSALEMSEIQQTKLKEVILQSLGTSDKIQFEIKQGLIAGIELLVDNKKIVWTFDGMIESYAEDLFEFAESNKSNEVN